MSADAPSPPSRARVRARLAVVLTIAVLVTAALVGVGAAALASWLGRTGADTTTTRVEELGGRVAVVVVAEESEAEAAAQARRDGLRWFLVALVVSFLPAAGVAWLTAGRLLGSVEQALGQVEATEQDRRRRLQEVVHELRTPLAVVGTNLDLAATDPGLEDDTAEFVDAARRAVERMRRTVDDLAGHGRLSVEPGAEMVDLGAAARGVAAEHAGPARLRGLRVVAAPPPAPVLLRADRDALRTAVGNLLANAVRLAPRGSTVSVGWGTTHGWAFVAVRDEGPGLPEALHSRVFERGWRGRHERDREPDDPANPRGLGLAIARQVTEAQGGLLSVVSEEGAGSTFVVWLPLDTGAEEADIVADDGIHHVVDPWVVLAARAEG